MGKIYVGQTKLRIVRTCNVDITGATARKIKYIKPSGTAGELTATELTAATGDIYFDVVSTTTVDEPGSWITWAYVTFSDGRSAAGEPVIMKVYVEGT
jgi:hypothetical protein